MSFFPYKAVYTLRSVADVNDSPKNKLINSLLLSHVFECFDFVILKFRISIISMITLADFLPDNAIRLSDLSNRVLTSNNRRSKE